MQPIQSEEKIGTPGIVMAVPRVTKSEDEVARLKDALDKDKLPHNNSRKRELKKALLKVESRRASLRCNERDDNGHRCTKKPHMKGNHRAFGKEWK
jgi:hypothetical protein